MGELRAAAAEPSARHSSGWDEERSDFHRAQQPRALKAMGVGHEWWWLRYVNHHLLRRKFDLRRVIIAVIAIVCLFMLVFEITHHELYRLAPFQQPGSEALSVPGQCTTWPVGADGAYTPIHSHRNGTTAGLKSLAPKGGWKKPAGIKIVALVFYGRKRTVDFLDCYLLQNLAANGGYLDEIRFMVHTNKEEDVEYLKDLVSKREEHYHIVDGGACEGSSYGCIWDSIVEDDTIYVKIDDDIVSCHYQHRKDNIGNFLTRCLDIHTPRCDPPARKHPDRVPAPLRRIRESSQQPSNGLRALPRRRHPRLPAGPQRHANARRRRVVATLPEEPARGVERAGHRPQQGRAHPGPGDLPGALVLRAPVPALGRPVRPDEVADGAQPPARRRQGRRGHVRGRVEILGHRRAAAVLAAAEPRGRRRGAVLLRVAHGVPAARHPREHVGRGAEAPAGARGRARRRAAVQHPVQAVQPELRGAVGPRRQGRAADSRGRRAGPDGDGAAARAPALRHRHPRRRRPPQLLPAARGRARDGPARPLARLRQRDGVLAPEPEDPVRREVSRVLSAAVLG